MRAIVGIRVVAWMFLLLGCALVVWQAASGHGSDVLFNVGVVAMISGSVLRVYGKYRRGKRQDRAPRKSPDEPS